MNVQKNMNPSDMPESKRLMSITEAIVYLGVGRSSAIKYLDRIGAKRKIGCRALYDKQVIDDALSNPEKS